MKRSTSTAPGTVPSVATQGIVTPEGVELDFAQAGLGSRILAFAVDVVVRLIVLWVAIFALASSATVVDETSLIVVFIVLGFVLVLGYPAILETVFDGRTPGKALLGIRVVTAEGGPVRFRHAAIRSALSTVDFFLGFGVVAVVSILGSGKGQRSGDVVAGTIVVRNRRAATDTHPVVFSVPPGWEGVAASIPADRVTSELYVLIRSYLLRVHDLAPEAAAALGVDLRDAVARRIGTAIDSATDPGGFLVTVAATAQRRFGTLHVPARPPGDPVPVWNGPMPAPVWGDAP